MPKWPSRVIPTMVSLKPTRLEFFLFFRTLSLKLRSIFRSLTMKSQIKKVTATVGLFDARFRHFVSWAVRPPVFPFQFPSTFPSASVWFFAAKTMGFVETRIGWGGGLFVYGSPDRGLGLNRAYSWLL